MAKSAKKAAKKSAKKTAKKAAKKKAAETAKGEGAKKGWTPEQVEKYQQELYEMMLKEKDAAVPMLPTGRPR